MCGNVGEMLCRRVSKGCTACAGGNIVGVPLRFVSLGEVRFSVQRHVCRTAMQASSLYIYHFH